MKQKRHLLELPILDPFNLYDNVLYTNNPTLQNKLAVEKIKISARYSSIWEEYSKEIRKFNKKHPIDRIFINNFLPDTFKLDLQHEITTKTPLGRCIDKLLTDKRTIELVEEPGYLEFESFLAKERHCFEYQVYSYLDEYIHSQHMLGIPVVFLNDYENGLAGTAYPYKMMCNLQPSQNTAIADIRAGFSAKKIDKSLKKGESGVAFLYAGDSPLSAFREYLPGVDLHYSKFDDAVYYLFIALSDLILKAGKTKSFEK